MPIHFLQACAEIFIEYSVFTICPYVLTSTKYMSEPSEICSAFARASGNHRLNASTQLLILCWSFAFQTTMCWCNPEDSTSFGFTWCQMCPDVPGNPCYSSTMLNTYCRPLSQVDYPSPLAICRAVSPFITADTQNICSASTTGGGASVKVSPLTPLAIDWTRLSIAGLAVSIRITGGKWLHLLDKQPKQARRHRGCYQKVLQDANGQRVET